MKITREEIEFYRKENAARNVFTCSPDHFEEILRLAEIGHDYEEMERVLIETKTCYRCNEQKPRAEFIKANRNTDGYGGMCLACKRGHHTTIGRLNPPNPRPHNSTRMRHNPVQTRAREILYNAVKSKEIVKPKTCQACPASPDVLHGHHVDYAYPLGVVWLCKMCHSKVHWKDFDGNKWLVELGIWPKDVPVPVGATV